MSRITSNLTFEVFAFAEQKQKPRIQFATPSETFENTKSSIYACADYNRTG